MIRCKVFHILGILSLYAEDLIFLIIGNEPTLLKTSFLVGWSELIFKLSISLCILDSLSSLFICLFFYHLVSFPQSSFNFFCYFFVWTHLLLGLSLSVSFLLHRCLGIFLILQRMETSLCLNITYYCMQTCYISSNICIFPPSSGTDHTPFQSSINSRTRPCIFINSMEFQVIIFHGI